MVSGDMKNGILEAGLLAIQGHAKMRVGISSLQKVQGAAEEGQVEGERSERAKVRAKEGKSCWT